MPDIATNLSIWTEGWDWSQEGEEWSAPWGGTDAMWYGALLPRLHRYLPAGRVLEIAPGHGRWSHYLKEQSDRLVLVDLAPNCIEHCQQRFASATNVEYQVNDGQTLPMVDDRSIDVAFSFDSLVHVDADALRSYFAELARVLARDGVAVIHHSNLGAYPRFVRASKVALTRAPKDWVRHLTRSGASLDLGAWRAEDVTADAVRLWCAELGLSCPAQERITWEQGPHLTDCITTVTRAGSRWDDRSVSTANRWFRSQVRSFAALYGEGLTTPGAPAP